MTTDDLAAEIAAHRPWEFHYASSGAHCADCEQPWPCLVARLAEREAALREAARGAIDGLTVADICHGPAFDSQSWGNDCDVCRVVRPLVCALVPAEDGEPTA